MNDNRIRELIFAAQWGPSDLCEWCHEDSGHGHAADCKLYDLPALTKTTRARLSPCCDTMQWHKEHYCKDHESDCPDRVIKKSSFTGRLGLAAENAYYDMTFCPWCGTRIQEDFPELEGMHISQRVLG